jgi:hypothetical protein
MSSVELIKGYGRILARDHGHEACTPALAILVLEQHDLLHVAEQAEQARDVQLGGVEGRLVEEEHLVRLAPRAGSYVLERLRILDLGKGKGVAASTCRWQR